AISRSSRAMWIPARLPSRPVTAKPKQPSRNPMKEIYVCDLQPNQIIVAAFLVQTKDVRFKKTGEGYLSLSLSDRTGEVEAKIWENVEELAPLFERDDFIKVKAAVQV